MIKEIEEQGFISKINECDFVIKTLSNKFEHFSINFCESNLGKYAKFSGC